MAAVKIATVLLALTPMALAARPTFTTHVLKPVDTHGLKGQFEAWAAMHEKPYLVGMENEYAERFAKFAANWQKIEKLRVAGANTTWTLSYDGPFMDLSTEEFKQYLGYRPSTSAKKNAEPFTYTPTSVTSIDWRAKGAVTEVKNQAQCGSCWAFSTTGGIEGANFLATGKLVSVSEQQLVSCDKTDQGCGGGAMDNGFQYVIKNGGIDTEGDYKYTSGGGASGTCDDAKQSKHVVTIDSFTDVTKGSEPALQAAAAERPISIAVDATTWQFYGGGVFNGMFGYCGTSLDHGVLLVGYDLAPSTKWDEATSGYYIVKNSWGPSWGEKGYIRLPVNRGKSGMCGLTLDASFPVKK